MAIKRYYATKDNTITNAFKSNLETRGVSGNMGQSDILEIFSIYAQATTTSSELSRILIEFDKYTFNKEYAKYNQKYFLYIIAVQKPKKRIYIYNITEIDNKTSNFYRWNWTDKMPKQTEFKNTEKDWKYVGYIDKIYKSRIIELE